MQEAKRIAPTIDPQERYEDLPAGDAFTVYRGAFDKYENPKWAISWTTNKNIAIWFAHRHRHASPVYQATIKRDKIIAYHNGRNEYEVMQHGNVQNIVKLDVTQKEVDAAMKWKKEIKKTLGDINL